MKPIDQTHLSKHYRGKWVALKADRRTVIASGSSAKFVLGAAKKKGCKHPVVTRVPRAPAHFIGYHLPA